jgi:membrane protease YdiL (CAAX protease family)
VTAEGTATEPGERSGRVRLQGAFHPGPPPDETPRSIRIELAVVFALTLGASGLRAVISLVDNLLKQAPLASNTVAVLAPRAEASWTDLALQLVSILVGLGWGSLGIYLLWRAGFRLREHIGLDWRWTDLGRAALLAGAIGIPGIAFYVIAYRLGFNVTVIPSALRDHWWQLPVQLLAALENGFLEEVLVVGYLLTRLRQLDVRWEVALVASALLRGSYHLYQGGGQALGNVLMGLVFGYVWLRWRRLWPLVVAHTVMDVVSFVGYTYLSDVVNDWLR